MYKFHSMKILQKFLLLVFATVAFSACSPNCQYCREPSVCVQCEPGYQLLENFSCAQLLALQGCRLYTPVGVCSKCIDGFTKFAGACYPPVPSCQQYGPGNICLVCATNYRAVNGKCQLSNNTACNSPGQGLYMGMCVQVPLTNCQKVQGDRCAQCNQGYQVMNGYCFKTGILSISGVCADPRPDGRCFACISPYYLNGNFCYNVSLDNCQINEGIVCRQCSRNFSLINGACVLPPKPEDLNCNIANPLTGECLECRFLYQLNFNRMCARMNLYCATADPNNGLCTSCLDQLRLVDGVCIYADPNCQYADYDNGVCVACGRGYTLGNGNTTCVLDQPCLNRNSDENCTRCLPNYQLIEGQCYLLPFSCVSLSAFTKQCSNCTNGTSFWGGSCKYLTSNCTTYDLQSGLCAECNPGYYLRDQVCSQLPDACLAVDISFRCITCRQNYILAEGGCVGEVENCRNYERTGCEGCSAGYFLIGGVCRQMPPMCEFIDNQGKCVRCIPARIVFNGQCVLYQQFCLDYNTVNGTCTAVPRDFRLAQGRVQGANILQVDDKGNIVRCSTGAQLYNNVNCVRPVANCVAYDALGSCSACSAGFSLNMTQCESFVNTCIVPENNATFQCKACNPNFVNINGTCLNFKNRVSTVNQTLPGTNLTVPVTVVQRGYAAIDQEKSIILPLPFNCIRQDKTTQKCLQCEQYYTLVNSNCVVFDANCVGYNARGICQGCVSGSVLYRGVCRSAALCRAVLPTGECLSCRQGTVRAKDSLCYYQPRQGCAYYDSALNCLGCLVNYQYDQQSKSCIPVPANCRMVGPTGQCFSCEAGYIPSNTGTCIKLIPNCRIYTADLSSCQNCIDDFIVGNGICYPKPKNCMSIDYNTLRCTACEPGYSLVSKNTLCVLPIANCTAYNEDRTCKTCGGGLTLSSGRCQNFTRMCAFYNPPGRCALCRQPYQLVDRECRIIAANCLNYTDGVCAICAEGFYLISNQCQPNPQNCLKYNGSACSSCVSGFSVKDGSCTQNIYNTGGCSQQRSPIECTRCSPGFTLSDKMCFASVCLRKGADWRCLGCPFRFELVDSSWCRALNCSRPDLNTTVCQECQYGYERFGTPPEVYCRVANCKTFNTFRMCTECAPRYTLNRTNQLCEVANCQSLLGDRCLICNPGYLPMNNASYCAVENCVSYNDALCTTCNLTYYLNEIGICIKDPRCKLFNDQLCQICYGGYVIGPNGVCRLANCANSTNDRVCALCQPGFDLVGSVCQSSKCISSTELGCTQCSLGYAVSNQSCVISNCLSLRTQDSCFLCNARFTLIGGFCFASNCTLFVEQSTLCRVCNPRYEVSNGVCLPKNCLVPNQITKGCSRCQSGFELKGDSFCAFINCRVISNDNRCEECYPGYDLDSGLCTRLTCMISNPGTGLCEKCLLGYRLESGVCISYYCQTQRGLGKCLSCQPGYSLYAQLGYCYLPDLCRVPNTPTECLACLPGYSPRDGYCTPRNCLFVDNWRYCIQCVEGYFLRNNTCYPNGCKQIDNDYNCLECGEGYVLKDDGRCSVVNCETYYSGSCVRCFKGYVLGGGVCRFTGCDAYDRNGGCLKCLPGFGLRDGYTTCISNACNTVNSSGQCQLCDRGYILGRGICLERAQLLITSNCLMYNYASKSCEDCPSTFVLDGIYCKPLGCDIIGPQGCQSCKRDLALLNDVCLAISCASYQNNICVRCNEGYILSNDNKCIYVPPVQCKDGQYPVEATRSCVRIPIPNCLQLDSTLTRCTRCDQGQGIALVEGACLNISNCLEYTRSGCTKCNVSSYLNGGLCYLSNIVNCNNFNSAGQCLGCASGFILNQNRTCTDIKGNCLQWNETGCTQCQNNYVSKFGFCYQLPPNCRDLNYSQDMRSFICSSCIANYGLILGQCIIPFAGCSKYSQDQFSGKIFCQLCGQNFKPNTMNLDIPCIKDISGCGIRTPEGKCRECLNNSVLIEQGGQQYCVQQVNMCANYTKDGCMYCEEGFTLKRSEISRQLFYCSSSSPQQAEFCDVGYYKFNNICIPNPIGCLAVNNMTMGCNLCNDGYELASGTCRKRSLQSFG